MKSLLKEDYRVIHVTDVCGGYTIVEGVITKAYKVVKEGKTPAETAKFFGGKCLSYENE